LKYLVLHKVVLDIKINMKLFNNDFKKRREREEGGRGVGGVGSTWAMVDQCFDFFHGEFPATGCQY